MATPRHDTAESCRVPGSPPAGSWKPPLLLALGTALAYYFSNPKPYDFDYTFRIAEAFTRGRLGLVGTPPSWLNEMVPYGGMYYSAFPLGSVLTMLPVALLKTAGVLESYPASVVVAFIAGGSALFFFLLSARRKITLSRRIVLALFPLFGSWMWCNLSFGGAWQAALGFAVLGQAGALYFTLVNPCPFAAGALFALAFGNRTEVILAAPIFIYFFIRGNVATKDSSSDADCERAEARGRVGEWRGAGPTASRALSYREALRRGLSKSLERLPTVARFLCVPAALGVLTLAYNFARFSSVVDFGYAKIPGVLQEPWYQHGIFSIHAIPNNAEKMLLENWKHIGGYPYYTPTGFGGSIFQSSPFLFLLFRSGACDRGVKAASWVVIGLLTLALWLHGNPGGWQYSYRYAMILLPWMFLILLENGPRRASAAEVILLTASAAINAYATYLFLWTDYVKP